MLDNVIVILNLQEIYFNQSNIFSNVTNNMQNREQ